MTTPLSVLPYRPSHCRPTCAVFTPSLRSPLSSITSTPPPYGAVAGSQRSSSSRRSLTRSGSHRDSDKKNCSRCTAGCCAPVTGSAPASAVSVLFRSRGASRPARYSRNPRRCASDPNRSSNRAAYPSSGPGAAGHGRRAVITHPTAQHDTTPRHTANLLRGQQTTVSRSSPDNHAATSVAAATPMTITRPSSRRTPHHSRRRGQHALASDRTARTRPSPIRRPASPAARHNRMIGTQTPELSTQSPQANSRRSDFLPERWNCSTAIVAKVGIAGVSIQLRA